MEASVTGRPAKFCHACGASIDAMAELCPKCGVRQAGAPVSNESPSDKRILPALLLCLVLGVFGAHRFYVGKIGTAILIILTFGGFCGIWPLVDFILIVTSNFRDQQGRKLTQWT